VAAHQQGADGLEPGPEEALRHRGGKLCPGERLTVGTAAGVALVLGGLDEDGRQVEHLVTTRWGSLRGRLHGQAGVAVGTGGREEGKDVVTGVGRFEEARGALVAGLGAGLTTGGSGLGGALGSVGRIGRGWTRGVLGVLVEASLQLCLERLELSDAGAQVGQLGLDGRELGELGFELGQAGLEHLATGAL
jgi:hypothetical protein